LKNNEWRKTNNERKIRRKKEGMKMGTSLAMFDPRRAAIVKS
jgi:hypothetical protein